ncbi:MAG: ParB N-terminal domain-containing protein [Xanthobacteraceae bacterium]
MGKPSHKPIEKKNIGFGGINILPGRMREVRPEKVAELVKSIREQGLIRPISVRPRDGGGYWLMGGLHRLLACKKLKQHAIRCAVYGKMSDDEAKLIEIDD